MSIKDITVVITTFKSSKKIKKCLNSIDRQSKVLLIENSNDSSIKESIVKEFMVMNLWYLLIVLMLSKN